MLSDFKLNAHFEHEILTARSLLARLAILETGARKASFYLKESEDMNKGMLRILIASAIGLVAIGAASAQTTTQNINVTVRPAMTVEEKVANEFKEKELRKAAEEKLAVEESARIAALSPKMLLGRARTIFAYSDTKFFEEVLLQSELRKHPEMVSGQLSILDGGSKRDIADLIIEIDRPLFTYTFTYEILDRRTGMVLATGKVTAFDGNAAAPKLAEKIIEEIRNARGEAKPKR